MDRIKYMVIEHGDYLLGSTHYNRQIFAMHDDEESSLQLFNLCIDKNKNLMIVQVYYDSVKHIGERMIMSDLYFIEGDYNEIVLKKNVVENM